MVGLGSERSAVARTIRPSSWMRSGDGRGQGGGFADDDWRGRGVRWATGRCFAQAICTPAGMISASTLYDLGRDLAVAVSSSRC